MMEASRRQLVRARAGYRCEYCRIHEDAEPYSFHIEHIVPKKHEGTDRPENLAWSCQNCNLFKGANLAGLETDEVVALFHPRKQTWTRHFRWKGPVLIGKTKCGRVTIRVLKINSKDRVDLRKLLITHGDFPI
jgi:hypothetical protein